MRLTPDFFDGTQIEHSETQMPSLSEREQLQEFATHVTQIFSLEAEGIMSPNQAYSQIKSLITELKTRVIGN
ncbi:DUF7219 family protein [Planktothrix serta]|nr:hypothetical protein [Planktothrix serta]